jgi:hypothetical protein
VRSPRQRSLRSRSSSPGSPSSRPAGRRDLEAGPSRRLHGPRPLEHPQSAQLEGGSARGRDREPHERRPAHGSVVRGCRRPETSQLVRHFELALAYAALDQRERALSNSESRAAQSARARDRRGSTRHRRRTSRRSGEDRPIVRRPGPGPRRALTRMGDFGLKWATNCRKCLTSRKEVTTLYCEVLIAADLGRRS